MKRNIFMAFAATFVALSLPLSSQTIVHDGANRYKPHQSNVQALEKPKNKPVAKRTTKPVKPKQSPQNKPQALNPTTSCAQLRTKLARLGVPANQLDAAITLAQRESGCNSSAVNASSGACGEFQSLPCGKWGQPGTDEYLRGAINYANSRYGGYNGALAHSYQNGWY